MHVYASVGDYRIVVRATDGSATAEATVAATIAENHAPEVRANGPYTATEGGHVTLAATVSDSDGDSVLTDWTFEGASVAAGMDASASDRGAPTISAVDDCAGRAECAGVDSRGAIATATAWVTFVNAPARIESCSVEPSGSPGGAALQVAFDDAGVLDTHSVTVDWGDADVTAASVDESGGAARGPLCTVTTPAERIT